MKTILESNKQDFFLAHGTLLGMYRENKFIDYDKDIDIGILKANYDASIIQKIHESGNFKLFQLYGKESESLEICFEHTTGTLIDIFLYYPIAEIDPDTYYWASFNYKCDTRPGGYCKWKRHIRGFKSVMFLGQIFNIPSNTVEYLTESYGVEWNIPKEYTYRAGVDGEYKNLM
jgi:phosphorylcholine metabolism protein LicD